jgi:hypothetical protein
MANKYWVGGSGNWDASTTTHWSATSGGAGGSSVPTSADDVFFDASSGAVTVTLTATVSMQSLTCTGFTGTLVGTGQTFSIGSASGGALTLDSGMTVTGGRYNMVATSDNAGAGWPITSAGKSIPGITLNGLGGRWTLQDNLTVLSDLTQTLGSFLTNNKTCNFGSYVSAGTGVRSLNLGTSTITVSISAGWNLSNGTNMSVTATSSTIIMTGSSAAFVGGGKIYNNIQITGSGVANLTLLNTVTNLTRNGTTASTDGLSVTTSLTVTGLLTLAGGNVTRRLLIFSSTVGTQATLTAASVSIDNCDFMDIKAAGAIPFAGNSLGDSLGNSNITFDAPTTQTRTGAGGNWSTAGNWTSRVPLPQDTVIVSSGASGTIATDMARLGASVDFTGFNGTVSFTTATIYGSLTLDAGMTLSGTQTLTLAGRGSHTVTSNGKTLTQGTTFNGPGSTYTLSDAFTTAGTLSVTGGTFTTNNNTVTCLALTTGVGTISMTLNFGTSTVNLTGTAASAIFVTNNGVTVVSGTPDVVITNASANARTFIARGGSIFNSFTYTVAGSTGIIDIATNTSGAIRFNTFTVNENKNLRFSPDKTYLFTNFNVNGVNKGCVYLPGVAGNYISAPDSPALSITGDITLLVRVALDDWTPATNNTLFAKSSGTSNQRAYQLLLSTTGTLQFLVSSDGINNNTATSSVTSGVADGSAAWVLVSWRASDGRTQFYTASGAIADPLASDFTQLGTNQTAAAGSIFDSTALLEIGSGSTGTTGMSTGAFYRAKVYNGVFSTAAFGGTLQFDADLTAKPVGANGFTESSANAATVTITGALAQVGDGRVALTSATPGSNYTLSKSGGVVSSDYLSIQDSAATGGAVWYAGTNSTDVSNNSGWIFLAASSGGGATFMMMGV